MAALLYRWTERRCAVNAFAAPNRYELFPRMVDSSDTPAIISRQEAKAANLAHFYTGVPCMHGHDALRTVSDGACKKCRSLQKAAQFQNNKPTMMRRNQEYAANNKEKMYEYTKKWRGKNKERFKSKQNEWKKSNPEYHQKWYAENSDRRREVAKIWRDNNPEKVKAIIHKRRALESNAEGYFLPSDIKRIMEMQRSKCAICRRSIKNKYHIDHIMPLSRGGTNWPHNLQLLCPSCNVRKSTKDPIQYMQERGMLL
jgi:5-methylcytosine-specific restriction endonuclease McrA